MIYIYIYNIKRLAGILVPLSWITRYQTCIGHA